MHLTGPPSRALRNEGIVAPEQHGRVAWSQFNATYGSFMARPWWRTNEGTRHPLWLRVLRLGFAWAQPGRHAVSRLATKASLFSQLTLPPDPSIVFFGAEAGWEALILRALFGEEGQLLLIDDDPAAYDRYRRAPAELRITVPGAQQRQLTLRRDHSRIEYARADFFDYEPSRRYDVGIDWGLLEHFDDPGKQRVLRRFQRFLVRGGMQVTSTPRDRLAVRLFYRAFADELNFGYRELLSASELKGHVQRAGFVVERAVNFLGHVVVVSRMPA